MSDPTPQALPPAQYFNVMKVSHTPREFFFDLAQFTGEAGAAASLVGRLVTSPEHAKAMLEALADNVGKFEARFGSIRSSTPPLSSMQ
ncbi:MAG TPA: DUF3467 domain-containing protein [Myxococcota bacterium]|nr:DUF3467 domain-containing protein [Myxococcota bacterium]